MDPGQSDTMAHRCPSCGERMMPHVVAADRAGSATLPIARCPRCGLGRTARWGPVGEAAPTGLPAGGPLRWVADAIIRRELTPTRALPVGASIVDVGAGSGARSRQLARLGYRVTALEPDIVEAAAARADLPLEVAVVATTLEDWPGEEVFDGALMSHVLEHIDDPVSALSTLGGRLSPGGLLVVMVPNAGSAEARLFGGRWHGWEPSRHRWHYTATALRGVLERAGYRDVRVSARGAWMYPASLAYSLAPGLDPQVTRGARAVTGRLVAAALIPVSWAATRAGRGPQLVAVARTSPRPAR